MRDLRPSQSTEHALALTLWNARTKRFLTPAPWTGSEDSHLCSGSSPGAQKFPLLAKRWDWPRVLGAGAVLHDRPFLEQTLGEAGAARTLPSIFFCIGKKKVAGTAGRGSCGVCVCVCVCVSFHCGDLTNPFTLTLAPVCARQSARVPAPSVRVVSIHRHARRPHWVCDRPPPP